MSEFLSIPCVLMRGGTSRGPYFLETDLSYNGELRDRILIAALGSGHPLEIDGVGGGIPATSKVAIVSKSARPGVDVDYLFAQVKVDQPVVDTSPNCGNMLAGVGPFAIEAGLVRAGSGTTTVRIFNVNTGKLIDALVPTPNGEVTYSGDASIDAYQVPQRRSVSLSSRRWFQDRQIAARRSATGRRPWDRGLLRRCGDASGSHSRRRFRKDGLRDALGLCVGQGIHGPPGDDQDRSWEADGHQRRRRSRHPEAGAAGAARARRPCSTRYFMPHQCQTHWPSPAPSPWPPQQ